MRFFSYYLWVRYYYATHSNIKYLTVLLFMFHTEKTINYYKSQRPKQPFLNYSLIAEVVGQFKMAY